MHPNDDFVVQRELLHLHLDLRLKVKQVLGGSSTNTHCKAVPSSLTISTGTVSEQADCRKASFSEAVSSFNSFMPIAYIIDVQPQPILVSLYCISPRS